MYNSCINIFAWQRSLNIEFTTIVYCKRNCWPGLLIQQRLLEVISKHRKYHLTEVISKHKMTILWKFCMKFSHLCVVYQLRKEKKNSLHRPGSVRLFDFLPKHGCTSLLKNQNPPAQHHNYILSSWGKNKAWVHQLTEKPEPTSTTTITYWRYIGSSKKHWEQHTTT